MGLLRFPPPPPTPFWRAALSAEVAFPIDEDGKEEEEEDRWGGERLASFNLSQKNKCFILTTDDPPNQIY
jgi:hypothetical protein